MLLCCGQAFIDRVFYVTEEQLRAVGVIPGERRLVSPAESISLLAQLGATSFTDVGGGASANSLAIFAALGGKARFMTSIGADDLGATFKADLETTGVEVYPEILAAHQTGLCLVAVSEGGTRTMFMSLGAATHLDCNAAQFDDLATGDWVLVEAYNFFSSAPQLVERIIENAKSRGASVAFSLSDPGVVQAKRENLLALIDRIDLLVGNEAEHDALGIKDRVLPSTRRVVSHGRNGASLLAAGSNFSKIQTVPAISTNAIDTTGAGDALFGALLYGESIGLSSMEALRRASRVAAEVVSVTGARLSPNRAHAVWSVTG